MSHPIRIQRKRSKGWKMPDNTIYVGRGSKFGNPFTVENHGRDMAVKLFRNCIKDNGSKLKFNAEDVEQLRGKNLACWCRTDQPCHADVLLELANLPNGPKRTNE
jgi:hypothetical protein